ncbi:MAG: nucleotidyl transferase AbiEii/AbiGii toxin family protein [Gammaproteobacteria bacterium]
MFSQPYKKQVALLLNVLPEIAKEDCFALHGGTAINFYYRDMPRLSIDIDLTYVPIENRLESLRNIKSSLQHIKERLEKVIPNARLEHQHESSRILVSLADSNIKIEVNQIRRGVLGKPSKLPLRDAVQDEFSVFCEMPIVPHGQLYGGKICAALDRQHPRDLFDVKYLLDDEGFTEEIKTGFLLGLVSSNRPISEIIAPNFLNQRELLEYSFEGMSEEPFTYEDFEGTRERLVSTIHKNLTDIDKEFLLSVKNATPDWSVHNFEKFPAVQWKLHHLQKLRDANPEKFKEQYDRLKRELTT